MTEQPSPTSVKPEFRIAEKVTKEAKKWTETGKQWLARLRGKADEKPRAVIEEVAEAPQHKEELIENKDKDESQVTAIPVVPEVTGESVEAQTEKVPFEYKQPVIRLSGEQVVSDESFPAVSTSLTLQAKDFAVQVPDSSTTAGETGGFMIATDKSGRQLFSEPIYNIDYGGRRLTTVLVKSTGMPEVVRRNWEEYQGATEPFFFAKKIAGGDVPTGLIGKDEFMGLASKEDQRLDAENSLRLHKAGAKVRIPLAGWQVKELRVAGKWQDVQWFKDQGYEGEELFQSAWGMTCPLRLNDINYMLTQAVAVNKDPSMLDPLLRDFVQLAKKDQSQPYQELASKWGEVGDNITNDQRVELWTDFGIAISKTMGQNFEALEKANLVHGNLHTQNITFFGELCDCSTVKEGLIQSGGEQKIGDDVDSFADGMREFADRILRMQGVDTWNDSLRVGEMLDNVFYPEVKRQWKSYEEWVQINTQQLLGNKEKRDGIRSNLVESWGEDHVTEKMITDEMIRKTGGEKRFRTYG